MKISENIKLLLFFGSNSLLALLGMIYLFVYKVQGLPMAILTGYFCSVIASYFVVFMIKPGIEKGTFKIKYLSWIVIFLTLGIGLFLLLRNRLGV